jgi:hypothetical protein
MITPVRPYPPAAGRTGRLLLHRPRARCRAGRTGKMAIAKQAELDHAVDAALEALSDPTEAAP